MGTHLWIDYHRPWLCWGRLCYLEASCLWRVCSYLQPGTQEGLHCPAPEWLAAKHGERQLPPGCSPPHPHKHVRGWVWGSPEIAPISNSLKCLGLWFPLAISFYTWSLLLPIFRKLGKFSDWLMAHFLIFEYYFWIHFSIRFGDVWYHSELSPLPGSGCHQWRVVLTLAWVTEESFWGALAKNLHPEILDDWVEIRNLSSEL